MANDEEKYCETGGTKTNMAWKTRSQANCTAKKKQYIEEEKQINALAIKWWQHTDDQRDEWDSFWCDIHVIQNSELKMFN